MTGEETRTLNLDWAFSDLNLPENLETFEERVRSEEVDLAHSKLADLCEALRMPTLGVRYESTKFDLERCGLLGREVEKLAEEELKVLYMYVLATESETVETEKVVRMIEEFSRPLQEDGLVEAFRGMTRSTWGSNETARKQDSIIRKTIEKMGLENKREKIRKTTESFLGISAPFATKIITGAPYLNGSLPVWKDGKLSTMEEEGLSKRLINQVIDKEGGMCAAGGCKERENLLPYHIDGDLTNNQAENIVPLCKDHERAMLQAFRPTYFEHPQAHLFPWIQHYVENRREAENLIKHINAREDLLTVSLETDEKELPILPEPETVLRSPVRVLVS